MSEAGRDDVWTDLEQLLKDGVLSNGSACDPDSDGEAAGEAACRENEGADDDGRRPELPFEDLLTELLGSWEDEPAAQAEGEGGSALTEEPQVSLPDLMARMMEGPETFETETLQSLEALQQRLIQEPSVDEPALPQTVGESPSVEVVEAAAAQVDEPPAPEGEIVAVEEAIPLDQAVPEIESQQNEPGNLDESADSAPELVIGFGDLPAPGLKTGLLASLLSRDEGGDSASADLREEALLGPPAGPPAEESPAWTDDLLAALVQSDEQSAQAEQVESSSDSPAIWEALPAPAPPNLVEPMLFEPPLPPDSVLDWPMVEQKEAVASEPGEASQPTEGEGGAEHDADDSLRRLVGLMLAEIAAAASPSELAPSAETSVERTTERFLSFSLAGEVYAVDLAGILETDRLPRITRVPGLPAWAIGVSNLRGTILPVVDLRRLLNLEESENPSEGRILVARLAAGDAPAALVVDRLEGVALLAPSELHPAPQWLDSKILPYLEGIGSFKGRLVNVLDLGRLFSATGVNGEEPVRTGEAA